MGGLSLQVGGLCPQMPTVDMPLPLSHGQKKKNNLLRPFCRRKVNWPIICKKASQTELQLSRKCTDILKGVGVGKE